MSETEKSKWFGDVRVPQGDGALVQKQHPNYRPRDRYDEMYRARLQSGQIESEADYWKRKKNRGVEA
jgi:hypothetical protein